MRSTGDFTIVVEKVDTGKRLDAVISSYLYSCSRTFLSNLIRNGSVLVLGEVKKPGYRVKNGDKICGIIPALEPVITCRPEDIQLDILYEDEHIIIVNKPPGLVVYPAPGHYSGTLVNALLYHCPEIEQAGEKPRPGIVHRLDKDTSGTIIVAKNRAARNNLSLQFKSRKIKKKYLALVYGVMKFESGTILLPIGRHPVDRKKMSTTSLKARRAETLWQVRENYTGATLIELDLKTGRTHQIRVHCAAISHPVVGDLVYAGRHNLKKSLSRIIKYVPRQMLHAWKLEFIHPAYDIKMSFKADVPQDMKELISALRNETKNPGR